MLKSSGLWEGIGHEGPDLISGLTHDGFIACRTWRASERPGDEVRRRKQAAGGGVIFLKEIL